MKTNRTVTLFRFDKATGEYTRIGSFFAWVWRQTRIRSQLGGTVPRDVFDIRIEKRLCNGVEVGDLILFEGSPSSSPPLERCSTVSAVTENLAGLCPHWHIEAENQYR